MKQIAPFAILFEDEYIAAVNKAAGIPVSPDRWDDTKDRLDKLVAGFLAGRAGEKRLYTVHRIDQDTSGLVVFAKDAETHRLLSKAFEDRQVKKRYIAVVHGRPGWEETVCDLPLVPNGNKRHLTIIDKYRGKKSLTRFRVLGGAGSYSAIEAVPATGRTHQIRVHLAHLGCPVVCDPLYGSPKSVLLSSFKRNWRGDPLAETPLLARLGLHAAELELPPYRPGSPAEAPDPEGGEFSGPPGALRLEAPLARDMAALIKQMEKQAGKRFMNERF
ncbi:MAG: RNA pseudouridine synthase [Treponema sp.]|jgi:RluA family pseudouridine synthase|nr:RNA pseudouridine synthase [Treponema sp.]